jgi:hypothetical protein
MSVQTISDLSADDVIKLQYAKGKRGSQPVVLAPEKRYAVCVLRLNDAVVPGDYPTLKTDIEAVTGVENIELLFDRVTPATASLPSAPNDGEGNPQHYQEKAGVRVDVDLVEVVT